MCTFQPRRSTTYGRMRGWSASSRNMRGTVDVFRLPRRSPVCIDSTHRVDQRCQLLSFEKVLHDGKPALIELPALRLRYNQHSWTSVARGAYLRRLRHGRVAWRGYLYCLKAVEL